MIEIRKALDLIEPSLRWRFTAVAGTMLVTAVLQTGGVISVMPFVGLAADPEVVHRNQWMARAHSSPGRPARAVSRHNRCFYGVHARADKWVCRFQPLDEFSVRGTCTGDYRSSCSLGIYTSPIVFTLNRHTSELQRSVLGDAVGRGKRIAAVGRCIG